MLASPLIRRVCVVLSLGPLSNLYAFAFHVLFCVLRLTNIGFVQCFSLSPLWSLYAYVCHIMLCVLCLTNIGFVQCYCLGFLLSLYACVSRFVMRTSPHKLRVCAVLAPRFPLEFCTRVFLCFACFASQTPGLWSAFPSAPFEFVCLCLSRFVMRSLPRKHRVCKCFSLGLPFLKRLYCYVCHVLLCVFSLTNIGFVQCLSLGPLLSLYAYLCHVMVTWHVCHKILDRRWQRAWRKLMCFFFFLVDVFLCLTLQRKISTYT